jgi:hypothetical protein
MNASCARLVLVALLATAPGSARAEGGPVPAPDLAFQQVAFHELLGVAPTPALTFPIPIPSHYRERRSSNNVSGDLIWAAPADWDLIRLGRAASGRHGMLVVERSKSLRYDARRGEFHDGTGLNESNLAERLARHGAHESVIRRLDRDEVPILLVESELGQGEHLRVLFVQFGHRTRVLTYIGQTPWSAADELVWGRVRDAIAPAPAPW